jgi:hypothetical protein
MGSCPYEEEGATALRSLLKVKPRRRIELKIAAARARRGRFFLSRAGSGQDGCRRVRMWSGPASRAHSCALALG